ncbi:hypothetical protein HYX11_00540 [Candidatus Woesearchaeota archaeon]|nr:hypothetical protein [Candidatus Woesearchaeota archaeon]
MKKVLVSIAILVLFLFIVGCVDYKTTDVPKEETKEQAKVDDASLVKEIANVEKEVQASGKTPSNSSFKKEEVKTDKKNSSASTNSSTSAKTAPEPKKTETIVKEVTLPKPTASESKQPVKIQTEKENDVIVVKVKENELLHMKVNAVDPDKDLVTLNYGKPLDKNGDWQTNYGDAGEYLSSISASDGKLTTLQKLKIIVQRVNVPPTIEGIKDLVVKEGDLIKLNPKIVDPNNDPVTVTLSSPLDKGKWQTDYKSAGEYLIKVRASDGELATEKKFKLTVEDVNVPPKVDNLPSTIHVKEGDLVVIKPVINDPDPNDKVKMTISKPVGDSGVWQTGYTDHGEYFISVTVTDGKDTIKKEVRVTVDDVNAPPVINDIVVERQ